MYTPLAFFLAAILAAFSAFSYAELSARFPLSAGEAVYTQRAFGRSELSIVVGLMIVCIGVVSAATLINGFVGYLDVFVHLPAWQVMVLLILVLSALAMWGISESAWVAAITTLIELGGLLLILAVALPQVDSAASSSTAMMGQSGTLSLMGCFAGAFVAFYAFIGFEDIVNVAEEVRQPERTLPRAILIALAVATALYMLTAWVSISLLPPQELAASAAPLSLVYLQATGKEPVFISLIGLSAVINGALIQIVMASRVLYGMAAQGWIPAGLSRVNPHTRTPLRSTLLVTGMILVLALWLPLITLAEITSLITLIVFSLVNLSLWRIKIRDPKPVGIMTFPLWLPICGFLFSSSFAAFQLWRWVAL